MFRFITACVLWFLCPVVFTAEAGQNRSLEQLENRLQAIDAELETLAHLSLRSDSGSIGYYSTSYYTGDHHEWVQIDLGPLQSIDEVVIVPVLRRESKVEFKADGLPETLLIRAGTPEDPTGTIIATVDTDQPRIAPLVIPLAHTQASWIRIEAPHLSKRGVDSRYTFQLSEVFIFNGEENIALHRPVTASTASTGHSDAWKPAFLVDGHTPYIMDTARGDKTSAFIRLGAAPPALTIDLQQPQELSRIHLHAVDQSAMVPQAHFSDFGMPRHVKIEGALQADFSDAKMLVEARRESAIEAGPIMMWRFPETRCRYVRITAPTPKPDLRLPPVHRASLARSIAKELLPLDENASIFRIGFAEIELFAQGKNQAIGKAVSSTHLPTKIRGELPALTDGSNQYGQLLPLREWMRQLARRHELEKERPFVLSGINRRLHQQKFNLNLMYWISGAMVLCIAGGIIAARLMHRYHIKQTKKRIAADLHDELGANLHAIGLVGDLAKMAVLKEEPGQRDLLIKYLDEVRTLSEESGSAARYVSHLLDADCCHENLVQEMKHTAQRFLADFEHHGVFPPDDACEQLPSRTRIDLFLFYKECLTNIVRHSDASEVQTTLLLSGRQLTLTVSDNGLGVAGGIPASLKRRAQLMRGKISMESRNGTTIQLKLRT
jgi:signal transduction histidine kinase